MPHLEQRSPFWQAVALAWELGYTIAIPIVLLAFAGRFLDRKFGASPWFLLTGVLLSIIMSSIAVTMKVRRIMQWGGQLENRRPTPSHSPSQGEGEK